MGPAVQGAVFVMMMVVGLDLTVAEFRRVLASHSRRRHPRSVVPASSDGVGSRLAAATARTSLCGHDPPCRQPCRWHFELLQLPGAGRCGAVSCLDTHLQHGIEQILSFDHHFEGLPGISRVV